MESRFQAPADMRKSVFFDGVDAPARYSRFWMLLVLSSIIASAGVVADSTAAVIGAMIVAPLLGPIQGTMLATVLGDRRNLTSSLLLVVAGAATAVAIGFVVGLITITDIVAATNSQVSKGPSRCRRLMSSMRRSSSEVSTLNSWPSCSCRSTPSSSGNDRHLRGVNARAGG